MPDNPAIEAISLTRQGRTRAYRSRLAYIDRAREIDRAEGRAGPNERPIRDRVGQNADAKPLAVRRIRRAQQIGLRLCKATRRAVKRADRDDVAGIEETAWLHPQDWNRLDLFDNPPARLRL